MNHESVLAKHHRLVTLFLSLVFAAMYTQAPLYDGNQNSYFLHGLSDGGLGFLWNDWMANTTDPFPVFSILVGVTYRELHPHFFYFYYFALLVIFSYAVLGIGSKTWRVDRSMSSYIFFALSVAAVASPIFSRMTQRLFGVEVNTWLFDGVAGQYLLGSIFQPSTFGVLLFVSVYLFIQNKPFWAVSLLGVTMNIHASYVITAASLTLAYMIIVYGEEQNLKKVSCLALYSSLLAAPVLIYSLVNFGATSVVTLHEAQRILVEYRIPHHAKIEQWIGKDAFFKIGLTVLALWLHRNKSIRFVLLVPFATGVVLTLLQAITHDYFLALLFPWRVSAFLVPLSAVMIIAAAISYVFERIDVKGRHNLNRIASPLFLVSVAALVVGTRSSFNRLNPELDEEYQALINHVSHDKKQDDVYIVPADWEEFRIDTGAPILVDHKTHPYKDSEVLQWRERLQVLDAIYGGEGHRCERIEVAARQYGATKIVIDTDEGELDCKMLVQAYAGNRYRVYAIPDSGS
jgi:hypothetical protein